jgi:hypothetical protein
VIWKASAVNFQGRTDYYMVNRPVTLLALLGAVVFVSSAHAQGRGAFAPAPAGRGGTSILARHGARTSFGHPRRLRRFAGGWDFAPYFYSDYSSDYDYEPGISEAPPPEVIERTVEPAPPASVPAPGLILELQGDHWVRISNYGESQTAQQTRQPELQWASSPPAATPLPPAVLVFRDGHEEEIRKYLIAGATIYISSDYWTSGSWTQRVQIADLDVPATLKLNQERGAKFALPPGPNEVMIRP